MITAQSHPHWAWSKLLILLFVTCLALPSIAAVAAARPSQSLPAARSISAVSQTLDAAAAASAAADRALVSRRQRAEGLPAQAPQALQGTASTPFSAPATAWRSASAASPSSRRRQQRAVRAGAHAATQAPQLTVSGQTLTWTRPGNVSTFVFVRKVPGQEDQYSIISGTSATPPPVPGYTVHYSVRTNVGGSAWATEQSIAYPAPTSSGTPRSRPRPSQRHPSRRADHDPPNHNSVPITTPPVTTPPVTTPPATTPPVTTHPQPPSAQCSSRRHRRPPRSSRPPGRRSPGRRSAASTHTCSCARSPDRKTSTRRSAAPRSRRPPYPARPSATAFAPPSREARGRRRSRSPIRRVRQRITSARRSRASPRRRTPHLPLPVNPSSR